MAVTAKTANDRERKDCIAMNSLLTGRCFLNYRLAYQLALLWVISFLISLSPIHAFSPLVGLINSKLIL